MTDLNVAILGAGVVGLNTAMELQREFPNARYTIIAEKYTHDTTSEVAAGLFRPSNSFMGTTPQITDQWLRDAYSYYSELQKSRDGFNAGVSETSGFYFSRISADIVRSKFLEGLVPLYRKCTPDERNLYPGGWTYGCYYTTLLTECTKFLPWAMTKFDQAGGKVVKQRVKSFSDVGNYDVVFNCLGLGAKALCNDPILVPIRGQIFRVSAPWQKHFVFADDDLYIIPRSDSCYLGGTRNYESYNMKVNRHDSADIWEKCTNIVPRLKKAPVIKEWVGLRPHRTPTRVEVEVVQAGDKQLKVIHNYGHGGYGVTTAPGTAKYAVKLLREQHLSGARHAKL